MGYFASLISHTGLRPSVTRRTGLIGLEQEATRTLASQFEFQDSTPRALPPRYSRPNSGVKGASADPSIPASSSFSEPPATRRRRDAPQQGPRFPLPEQTDDFRPEVFRTSTPVPAPAGRTIPQAGESPVVRIGQSARLESGSTPRPAIMDDVRAWVSAPLREDFEAPSALSERPALTKTELRLSEQKDSPSDDAVSLEIGTIQIVIEETRPPVPPSPRLQRAAEEPESSWTLPSRHYLRP